MPDGYNLRDAHGRELGPIAALRMRIAKLYFLNFANGITQVKDSAARAEILFLEDQLRQEEATLKLRQQEHARRNRERAIAAMRAGQRRQRNVLGRKVWALYDEGMSQNKIARTLKINPRTVYDHLKVYGRPPQQ